MTTKLDLTALYLSLRTVLGDAAEHAKDERGDVPGWVMITLMSAVLVAALLAIAGPALESLFNEAISTVRSAG